eukprot:EG_transcript_4060
MSGALRVGGPAPAWAVRRAPHRLHCGAGLLCIAFLTLLCLSNRPRPPNLLFASNQRFAKANALSGSVPPFGAPSKPVTVLVKAGLTPSAASRSSPLGGEQLLRSVGSGQLSFLIYLWASFLCIVGTMINIMFPRGSWLSMFATSSSQNEVPRHLPSMSRLPARLQKWGLPESATQELALYAQLHALLREGPSRPQRRMMQPSEYQKYLDDMAMLSSAAVAFGDEPLSATISALKAELERDFGPAEAFQGSQSLCRGRWTLLDAVHRSTLEQPSEMWVAILLLQACGGSRVDQANSAIALRNMVPGPRFKEMAELHTADVGYGPAMLALYHVGIAALAAPLRLTLAYPSMFSLTHATLQLPCGRDAVQAAAAVTLYAVMERKLPRQGVVGSREAIPIVVSSLAIPALQPAGALLAAGLAGSPDVARLLGEAGALPPLIQLLARAEDRRGPSGEVARIRTLYALGRLAAEPLNAAAMVGAGVVPALVAALRAADSVSVGMLVACVFSVLAQSEDRAVKAPLVGAVDPLVALLASKSEVQAAGAAFCLGTLGHRIEDKLVIAAAGALPPLVRLLASGRGEVYTAAVKSLQNLLDHPANQDTVAAAGGIPALLRLLRNDADPTRRDALAALLPFALRPEPCRRLVAAGAVDRFVALLDAEWPRTAEMAAMALAFCAVHPESLPFILAAGAVDKLVALLHLDAETVQLHATMALAGLAQQTHCRSIIADAGAAAPLRALQRSANPRQRVVARLLLARLGAAG